MARKRLGEILVESGNLKPEQLERALSFQKQLGGRVGRILIDSGFVTEQQVVQCLSNQYGLPVARFPDEVPSAVLQVLPLEVCERHGVFPLALQQDAKGEILTLAMTDPTLIEIIDSIQFRTGRRVIPTIAGELQVQTAIRRHYHGEKPRADVAPQATPQFAGQEVDLGGGTDDDDIPVITGVMAGNTGLIQVANLVAGAPHLAAQLAPAAATQPPPLAPPAPPPPGPAAAAVAPAPPALAVEPSPTVAAMAGAPQFGAAGGVIGSDEPEPPAAELVLDLDVANIVGDGAGDAHTSEPLPGWRAPPRSGTIKGLAPAAAPPTPPAPPLAAQPPVPPPPLPEQELVMEVVTEPVVEVDLAADAPVEMATPLQEQPEATPPLAAEPPPLPEPPSPPLPEPPSPPLPAATTAPATTTGAEGVAPPAAVPAEAPLAAAAAAFAGALKASSFCPDCGADRVEGARFCPICGLSFSGVARANGAPSLPPVAAPASAAPTDAAPQQPSDGAPPSPATPPAAPPTVVAAAPPPPVEQLEGIGAPQGQRTSLAAAPDEPETLAGGGVPDLGLSVTHATPTSAAAHAAPDDALGMAPNAAGTAAQAPGADAMPAPPAALQSRAAEADSVAHLPPAVAPAPAPAPAHGNGHAAASTLVNSPLTLADIARLEGIPMDLCSAPAALVDDQRVLQGALASLGLMVAQRESLLASAALADEPLVLLGGAWPASHVAAVALHATSNPMAMVDDVATLLASAPPPPSLANVWRDVAERPIPRLDNRAEAPAAPRSREIFIEAAPAAPQAPVAEPVVAYQPAAPVVTPSAPAPWAAFASTSVPEPPSPTPAQGTPSASMVMKLDPEEMRKLAELLLEKGAIRPEDLEAAKKSRK